MRFFSGSPNTDHNFQRSSSCLLNFVILALMSAESSSIFAFITTLPKPREVAPPKRKLSEF